LHKRGVQLGVLLTSPLLRARQTAEAILGAWTAPSPQLEVCDALSPGKSAKKLSRHLRTLETESVAIVGHNPDLSAYLSWLVGSKRAQLHISKAGVAFVVADGVRKGLATLEWMVTPEWLG
jgi:phosphohistidine phosphatase